MDRRTTDGSLEGRQEWKAGRREGGERYMEQGKKEMGDKILNRDGERGLYV